MSANHHPRMWAFVPCSPEANCRCHMCCTTQNGGNHAESGEESASPSPPQKPNTHLLSSGLIIAVHCPSSSHIGLAAETLTVEAQKELPSSSVLPAPCAKWARLTAASLKDALRKQVRPAAEQVS